MEIKTIGNYLKGTNINYTDNIVKIELSKLHIRTRKNIEKLNVILKTPLKIYTYKIELPDKRLVPNFFSVLKLTKNEILIFHRYQPNQMSIGKTVFKIIKVKDNKCLYTIVSFNLGEITTNKDGIIKKTEILKETRNCIQNIINLFDKKPLHIPRAQDIKYLKELIKKESL